jgi:hypothetical protein
MRLSYITQDNHPSDIEDRNTVLLFKVTERKSIASFFNYCDSEKKKEKEL